VCGAVHAGPLAVVVVMVVIVVVVVVVGQTTGPRLGGGDWKVLEQFGEEHSVLSA
jgi:hypothetical protein